MCWFLSIFCCSQYIVIYHTQTCNPAAPTFGKTLILASERLLLRRRGWYPSVTLLQICSHALSFTSLYSLVSRFAPFWSAPLGTIHSIKPVRLSKVKYLTACFFFCCCCSVSLPVAHVSLFVFVCCCVKSFRHQTESVPSIHFIHTVTSFDFLSPTDYVCKALNCFSN